MYGVDQFTPIINPPQVAILAVGRRQADERMTLSLSFDHRAVNGADAAKFLGAIFDAL
jgi:pyruvate dehydrogenase E2 component (dihydrolipoamide acetyltransferase)